MDDKRTKAGRPGPARDGAIIRRRSFREDQQPRGEHQDDAQPDAPAQQRVARDQRGRRSTKASSALAKSSVIEKLCGALWMRSHSLGSLAASKSLRPNL